MKSFAEQTDDDAHAALKEAIAQHQAILASALDPIITIDFSGVIQSASNSIERVFGWTPREVIGQNINILMPSPHREAHDGYLANYHKTGQTNILGNTREFEALRKDGSTFPIELSVARVDIPGKREPLFTGIIHDISERKQAEAVLQKSERRFREMLHHMPLAAIIIDADGHITFCDEFLLRITGWTHDEVIGQNWFEMFVPPEQRVEVHRIFLNGFACGNIVPHYENEILTRAGERRYMSWSNTLVRDLDGRVIGAAGLGLDITERQRLEDELAQHRHHLEELVKERTSQLQTTHEQLRHADRLASIGTLAAGLGHDMNNVLLPIRARLDALDAADLPARTKEQFLAVRKSIAYLQQLSDGLHLLALDPNDPDASSGETNLAEWWNQIGPLLMKAVPKRVAFHCAFGDSLSEIALAPHRLTQAMLNLVVNAGEAIAGEGMVRVWAHAKDDRHICIGVTDTGEGMSEDVRQHAVDPFFTTKKRGLGTGLGLSLVRGVVQGAGGTMEIESEPGKGTTVMLKLPVAARHKHNVAEDAGRTAVVSFQDRRAASFVSALLQSAGFHVRYGPSSQLNSSRLWLVEASIAEHKAVKQFLRSDKRRRVILFGPASDDWAGLGIAVVDDPTDFELIRRTIGETLLNPTTDSPPPQSHLEHT